MRSGGKKNLLGVLVDSIDYDAAVVRIIDAAEHRRSFSGSCLAVHGVMTGVRDRQHRYRLNHLDLATPDGQPVRWGLNLLHRTRLVDRVYGPQLTLRVCEAAARKNLPVFFYGSQPHVVAALTKSITTRFPSLEVAGSEPSRFARVSPEESAIIAERIVASGARIVFVGLGCPRQEIFVYEYRDLLDIPLLAVGAAFDYLSGMSREPPTFIQDAGLQWMWRLIDEPRRLWKRYLLLNTAYVGLLVLQLLRIWRPDPRKVTEPDGQARYA